MVGAVDASLQLREIALNSVRVHLTADVFAFAVIDGVVGLEAASGCLVAGPIVGHKYGVVLDVFFEDGGEVHGADVGDGG